MDDNEQTPPPPTEKAKNPKKKVPLGIKAAAKVLTESGFGQREAARELGVSLDTVQKAMKDPSLDRKIIENIKEILPAKMLHVAFIVAERLTSKPELLAKMNPYMQTMIMAIMIDKARLMHGQSTENVEVRGQVADVKATLAEIQEMKKRIFDVKPE